MRLDAGEQQRMNEWVDKHLAEAHGGKQPYAGAIGGNFYFKVVMTTLGSAVSINCAMCERKVIGPEACQRLYDESAKFKQVLTDYSDW